MQNPTPTLPEMVHSQLPFKLWFWFSFGKKMISYRRWPFVMSHRALMSLSWTAGGLPPPPPPSPSDTLFFLWSASEHAGGRAVLAEATNTGLNVLVWLFLFFFLASYWMNRRSIQTICESNVNSRPQMPQDDTFLLRHLSRRSAPYW